MKADLKDRFVFLSASYPQREYRKTADNQEIASAVKAMLGAVFRTGGRVVFGGHPTISPLVLMMAQGYGQKGRVRIYQSRVFEASLSPATLELERAGYGQIVRTNGHPSEIPPPGIIPNPKDTPKSLSIMREAMLSQTESNPAAAIFIGGDTGLFEERTLFSVNLPGAPMYAIGGPGGTAREMAAADAVANPSWALRSELATSRNYVALMLHLVQHLFEHLNARGMAPGR